MFEPRVKGRYIGSYSPKIDGKVKAQGKIEYFDDVTLPGRIPRMCFAKVLTAPRPNVRIKSMDTSAAEQMPGVYAVLRYDDPEVRAIPITTHSYADIAIAVRGRDSITRLFDRYCLPDTGRWVGDMLGVAIAAETPELAEDALKAVKIEWEVLSAPMMDRESALKEGAYVLHPELNPESNRQPRYLGHMDYAIVEEPYMEYGDVDKAIEEADAVVTYSGTSGGNNVHGTMDFRGCVIDWRPEKMDVWTNHYFNDQTRMYLHEHLNVPLQRIRVRNGHLGGHMGKWNMGEHTFFLMTALLSKRAGRPVKFKMTCREEFLETRNNMTANVTLAATHDGTITATEFYNTSDSGAYFGSNTYPTHEVVVEGTELLIPKIPNVRANSFCSFSNRMPGAVMRGIGNVQYCFGFCQAVDMLAEELGLDPIDIAKKNVGNHVLPPPHNESIAAVLDACADAIDWKNKRHAPGEGPWYDGVKKRGVGMAFHNEWHAEWQETKRGRLEASMRITPDLGVILNAPTAETGAGGNSAAVLACCDQLSFLNVTPNDVTWINSGDTERGLRDCHPSDSAVSFLLCELMPVCAKRVKEEFLRRAALLLKRSEDELDIADARVFVKADPSIGMPAKDVMMEDDCVPIYGYAVRQNDKNETGIPYSAWFVEVEVDTETGRVDVIDLAIANDAGTVLHASGAESQQLGGQCMGIGESIYEELAYDDHTGTPLNTNYIDYKMPLMLDYPEITPILLEVWRGAGEYGACGMAEGTGTGTLAAIGNAIYNAIGVRLDGVPFKPEKILAALDEKEAAK